MFQSVRNINRAVLAACVVLGLCGTSSAQQPKVEIPTWLDPDRWCVHLEPSFLRPAVSQAIPGAQTTLLVAAAMDSEGAPRDLATSELRAMGVSWQAFASKAGLNADALLAKITPEFFRDKEGVITHARLQSDKPFAGLVVFAPGFGKLFEDTLGPDLLVAVPDRTTVFVFPKLAGPHKNFGEIVLSLYKNSAYPASLEIFEWRRDGLRAVGTYADD